jgi:hypothetical protein
MFARRSRWTAAFLTIASCCGMAGCGSDGTSPKELPPPTECQKRLLIIGDSYVRITQKLNRPPNNLTELTLALRDYARAQGSAGKVEDILKSPDDGQPFEIVWGVMLLQMKERGSDVPIVAFEKTGTNGQRNVLRGNRETLIMSERELRSAKFPSGYKLPF